MRGGGGGGYSWSLEKKYIFFMFLELLLGHWAIIYGIKVT